jgi:hypothetical protein
MKILFWAEGFRAIPSRPAAIALAWEIAPPNDAMAMPKPAARAITILTLLSPPAAGAAAAAPSEPNATEATATKSSDSRMRKEAFRNIGKPP